MADILIAEDNDGIRKAVKIVLEDARHSVRAVADGEAALAEYGRKRPDLLLLDIMMPRRNGLEVCETIRRVDAALPIILVTARTTERDKVIGLGAGADDYISKPFGMDELVARVSAALRRARVTDSGQAARGIFMVGRCTVDPASMSLASSDGRTEELTPRELDLLRMFAAHPGDVLTRERLLNAVWGVEYYGTTRTLDQHVLVLRRKLGTDAEIETLRNRGYRLKA